jgi:hypothetical protein
MINGRMVLAHKIVALASKAVSFLAVVAILALVCHYDFDGRSDSLGISVVKFMSKSFRSLHENRTGLPVTRDLRDQVPLSSPSFLRIDYKQNLLVWPVVATDLTRSPPFSPSLVRFS